MPPLLRTLRSLRRILGAVLALSVLLSTAGWAHGSCAARQGGGGADGQHVSHAAMNAAQLPAGPDDLPGRAGECPDHERHDAPSAGACGVAAHCVAAIVGVASSVASAQARVVERLTPLLALRPLQPSYQPESPPPKV